MKRSFRNIDLSIPETAFADSPNLKVMLDRIHALENRIDKTILHKKRMVLATNSEPEIKQKILRIFVYHRFVKATADDKAHFLVHVDGLLLDSMIGVKSFNMGMHFNKMRLVVDRKFNQSQISAEWSRDQFPQGSAAVGFAVKVYHEKACVCKIFLHRNEDVRQRYDLSPTLRQLLPSISAACTEEDVLLGVVHCATSRGLLGVDRDHRTVNCDEVRSESSIVHTVYV